MNHHLVVGVLNNICLPLDLLTPRFCIKNIRRCTMGCNCSLTNLILAVVIIIFTAWSDWAYSTWVVYLAAALILIHSLMHKHKMADAKMMKEGKRK